jgi:hypothetical protein
MTGMNSNLTLFALGMFTLSAIAVPASHVAAQGLTATTIELSAQQNDNDKKKKKGAQPQQGQPRVQQKTIQKQNVQPKVNVQQKQNFQQKKQINVQQNQQNIQQKKQLNVQQKNLNVQKNQINVQQKNLNIQQKNQINVQQKNLNVQHKKYAGPPKQFTPKHNNVVYKFNMKGSNKAFVNGKHYTVWHSNNNYYRIRHGNSWRTFVALGVLAPLLIGAHHYYPYAYIDAPGAYCSGLTEDGCQLVYDEVETIESNVYPQCVAYCPWQ